MLDFLLKHKLLVLCTALALLAGLALGHYFGKRAGYKDGHTAGYNEGYSKGYSDGYADKGKLQDKPSADVQTETQIIYQKVPYTGSDVQLTTPPPTVTVEINGKKQELQQKQETADLQVKTEATVKLKIPERRWVVGAGTDGKRPMFMLKAPVKDAVGVWVAGGKGKVMGGVSVSF